MSRIVVVDDESSVRSVIRIALAAAGHLVIEAKNGFEGLRFLENEAPDLLITDIIMPEKEGIETILAAKRRWPRLRVLAISGGGRSGNLDFLHIAKKLGADSILPKPFSPSALVAVVEEMLQRPEPPGALQRP